MDQLQLDVELGKGAYGTVKKVLAHHSIQVDCPACAVDIAADDDNVASSDDDSNNDHSEPHTEPTTCA